MAEYIDRKAFLSREEEIYCKDCGHRKNMWGKLIYDIGDAPCRACEIHDVLRDVDDFHAADVVERPRWISVEERLPEDEKNVLVYYGFLHNGVLSSQRHIGILAYFAFDPNPHWQYEGQGFLQVTHWMPLPEPPDLPEEENNA